MGDKMMMLNAALNVSPTLLFFLTFSFELTMLLYNFRLSVGEYFIQCTLKCSTNDIISLSNSI